MVIFIYLDRVFYVMVGSVVLCLAKSFGLVEEMKRFD